MFLDQPLDAVQLASVETVVNHELDGDEPELGLIIPGLDVDVGRFLPLVAKEEKAVLPDPQDSWHRPRPPSTAFRKSVGQQAQSSQVPQVPTVPNVNSLHCAPTHTHTPLRA
jgi:hypothetical protein